MIFHLPKKAVKKGFPGMKKWILAAAAMLLAAGILTAFALWYPEIRNFCPICPSYTFFHIYCPGCGTTRAVYCLLHGNLTGFFRNNIMLLPILMLVGLLLIRPDFKKHYTFLNIFTLLLILYTICRNIPIYPFTLLTPTGI